LEEYIYDTRGKLDARYAPYVQESEKESLLKGMSESEDWLYSEDGEDAQKSAYVKRLDGLKVMGDPIQLRWRENDDRPKAASQLREALNMYLTMAQSDDDKYSHIEASEKEKVVSTGSSSFLVDTMLMIRLRSALLPSSG
jgi:heat shock protein 4